MNCVRLEAPISVVALLVLVVGFHADAMRTNYNDKATHRAMAYFCASGEQHELVARLRGIWGEGDPVDRLSYCGSYALPNAFTRALERLPRYSAFQSVFLAHLGLHLLAVLFAVFALARIARLRTVEVCSILLLSLVPWLTIGSWAFPFANDFFGWHSWRTSYPRGAAVLLGSVAALAWAPSLDVQRRFRVIMGGTLTAFALLMHWQMAVLTIGLGCIAWVVPRVLRATAFLEDDDRWRTLRRRLFFVGLAGAAVKGGVVVAHLVGNKGIALSEVWATNTVRGAAIVGVVFAVFYFVASLWLVGRWRRVRHDAMPSVAAIGDITSAVSLGVALLVLCTYPWSPTSHEWQDTWTILLYEPSRRLVAVGHLAWFTLAWCAWRSTRHPFILAGQRTLVLCGLLGSVSLAYELARDSSARTIVGDETLMVACVSDVEGKPMRRLDDYTVYHAIANEFEGRLCRSEQHRK